MTLGESPFAVILTPSARTIVILRYPPAIVEWEESSHQRKKKTRNDKDNGK